MQMLKNMFGSDKKYYLELDESQKPDVVKAASKAAGVVKEKATELAQSQPVQQVVETVSEASSTVTTAAQENLAAVLPDQTPVESKSVKKSKSAKTKAKQNGKVAGVNETPQKAQPTLKNSGASSFDPPFWVAAMYNNNSPTNNNGIVAAETFATDNLMPTVTKYRRRPGGSLNKFKDMAKQAKTPKG
ncbi:MAG: hypothetical protein AAF298_25320 [Cyanobacteria bacterium P01_A01_bin.40]